MQDDDRQVVLDPRRRTISVGGETTRLQEKAWQVLRLLSQRAPAAVRRAEFIDEVWSGNHAVGDKGLNQALWTIRTALVDDARQPRFIRTLPRMGYQWIHRPIVYAAPSATSGRFWRRAAVGLGVAIISVTGVAMYRGNIASPIQSAMAASASVAEDGTRAYLRDRAIVVDMPTGCQRIVKADEDAVRFGNPVVSADGKRILFAVRKARDCKLVALELENGARMEFGSCLLWRS